MFEEARLKMLRVLESHGWLTADDALHCTGNHCWFITAHKP